MDETTTVTYAQPYEIQTKVGVEIDSKGQTKPNAEVKITRRHGVESHQAISDIIKADLTKGVDECMAAINEVLKRAGMGK